MMAEQGLEETLAGPQVGVGRPRQLLGLGRAEEFSLLSEEGEAGLALGGGGRAGEELLEGGGDELLFCKLFAEPAPLPEGFVYTPDFISRAEEACAGRGYRAASAASFALPRLHGQAPHSIDHVPHAARGGAAALAGESFGLTRSVSPA